ncbi:MAG: photosynthetic complex putative assembly protein PuhB [Pseudomonadota bacterium]
MRNATKTDRLHPEDLVAMPEPGLPEKLPEDERILWQGRPEVWALTCEALNLRWVIGYFVLVWLWWAGTLTDQIPFAAALLAAAPLLGIGAVTALLLLALGWAQARATMYTITDKRVVMRIGAALTMTLNLPFTRIVNANLARRRTGVGTLAFELQGHNKFSYLVCWPHVRPWHFRTPQPALRCIADAENVARIFTEAAEARVHAPCIERRESRDAAMEARASVSDTGDGATVAAE